MTSDTRRSSSAVAPLPKGCADREALMGMLQRELPRYRDVARNSGLVSAMFVIIDEGEHRGYLYTVLKGSNSAETRQRTEYRHLLKHAGKFEAALQAQFRLVVNVCDAATAKEAQVRAKRFKLFQESIPLTL